MGLSMSAVQQPAYSAVGYYNPLLWNLPNLQVPCTVVTVDKKKTD